MRNHACLAGVLFIALLGCSSDDDDDSANHADAGEHAAGSGGSSHPTTHHDAGSITTADAGNGMHGGSGGSRGMTSHPDAGTATHADAGAASSDFPDDTYGPWAGGSGYYAKFAHGPPSDAAFFPITVWLQSPDRAQDYAAIGVNTYIGLWEGPTEDQLSMLAAADMPVACDQNDVGLMHTDDDGIIAWTQQDEPDNAQAAASGNGYDPCIPASDVKNRYDAIKAKDDSRPVFLNLGQGVAHDYIGWGNECSATHPADYPDYLEGADIVSFDIYPVNETAADVAGNLWFVADGVKNLVTWSDGKKPVWNWIECTGIDDPSGKPTPEQVKAEVWMSIVAGSMGIGYFVHQFNPSFDEHALLDDDTMKTAVAAINQQITELAPVLNEKPVTNGGSVKTDDADLPVSMLLKRHDGATYVFAVGMRGSATHATFSGLTHVADGATVTVLGEDRTIELTENGFEDDFDAWGVHLYEIR
jgi:hypothetical protein